MWTFNVRIHACGSQASSSYNAMWLIIFIWDHDFQFLSFLRLFLGTHSTDDKSWSFSPFIISKYEEETFIPVNILVRFQTGCTRNVLILILLSLIFALDRGRGHINTGRGGWGGGRGGGDPNCIVLNCCCRVCLFGWCLWWIFARPSSSSCHSLKIVQMLKLLPDCTLTLLHTIHNPLRVSTNVKI